MGEVTIIEPGRAEKNYWRDVWRFRELFYILSWKDIKVRYKQTVIGIGWSILRPAITTVIFTIVFNKLASINAPGDIPYPLLVFAAMLPWQFFSNALSEAGNSLISNSGLISKVYFPRIILPASSVISGLIDFGISLCILAIVYWYYNWLPGLEILTLPIYFVLVLLLSLGAGLTMTTLNVKYRDFRHVIPFLIQFGLYITPVGYSSSIVPEKWKPIFYLNPMAGIIDGFRYALLSQELYIPGQLISFSVILLLLVLGISYFRHTEKSFADNI